MKERELQKETKGDKIVREVESKQGELNEETEGEWRTEVMEVKEVMGGKSFGDIAKVTGETGRKQWK